jgi:hypothetical protein
MVVSLVTSKDGVFLLVDGRPVGALTLEPGNGSRVAVVDLFGPVVEISYVNEEQRSSTAPDRRSSHKTRRRAAKARSSSGQCGADEVGAVRLSASK